MPNISDPDSYFITFDANGNETDRIFEVRHDSPRAPLLTINQTGTTTIYGPIVTSASTQVVSTTQGSEIVVFRDASGLESAAVLSDGTLEATGLRLPVNASIAGQSRLLQIEHGSTVLLELSGTFHIEIDEAY